MDMSHQPYALGTLLLGKESLVLEAWWVLGESWHGQFEEEKVLCTFFGSCICTVYPAYLIHCKESGITCKT
jgi:hypothetical protein